MANTDLQLNTTITLKDEFSSQMGGFASSVGRLHGMLESLNTTMNKISHIASTPMNNNFSNGLASIGRSAHRANIELTTLNSTLTRTVGLVSHMPSGAITATAGASAGGTRGLGAIRGYRGILSGVTRALSTVNANFFRGLGLINAGFLRGLGSIFSVGLRGLGGTGLRGLGGTGLRGLGGIGGGGLPSSNSPRAFGGFSDLLKNNLVTALVGAFGSMAVLKQAQKLFEDATKQMTVHQRLNHLKFVENGDTNIKDLKDKIFGASMRSKTNYLDFAQMVQSIGARAGGAFGSSGELVQFTELLQKIFTATGNMDASSRTHTAIRLSEALLQGQMESRELKMLIQDIPLLNDLITKTLGKSGAEMKKLASEGKITADIIKKAVFDNVDEINKKFLDMPDGWGEVMIRINNYAQHAFQGVYQKITDIFSAKRIQKIGKKIAPIFYKLAGIIDKLIDKAVPIIDWVIDNFDSLFNGISSLTVLLGSIIGIITTINILMATGPIGIIAGILVLLEVGIQYLNKINGTTYNLFSFISAGLVFIWESVMDFFKFVSIGLVFSIGMISRGILYIGNLIIKLGKGTIAIWRLTWVGIKWFFSSGIGYLLNSINWLCEKTVQSLTLVVKGFLDPLITGLNMLIDLSNKISGTKFDKIELSISPEKNGIVKFFSDNQKTLQQGIDQTNSKLGNETNKIIGEVFNGYEFKELDATVKQLAEGTANNIKIKDPLKEAGKALDNSANLWNFNNPKSPMLNWDKIGTGFDKSSVLNDIKKNTDDIRNNSDFSKYLRELADRNSINHFTSPTYSINLENQNTINSQADYNGFVTRIADEIKEALLNSPQSIPYGGAYA